MATDKTQRGICAIMPGERRFQRIMHRAASRHEPAARRGNPIGIYRGLGRSGDPRVEVEPAIVIGGKVENLLPLDDRPRAGMAIMQSKERVFHPEDSPDLPHPFNVAVVRQRRKGDGGLVGASRASLRTSLHGSPCRGDSLLPGAFGAGHSATALAGAA